MIVVKNKKKEFFKMIKWIYLQSDKEELTIGSQIQAKGKVILSDVSEEKTYNKHLALNIYK